MVWGNPLPPVRGRAGSDLMAASSVKCITRKQTTEKRATPANKYLGRKLKICLRGNKLGKKKKKKKHTLRGAGQ